MAKPALVIESARFRVTPQAYPGGPPQHVWEPLPRVGLAAGQSRTMERLTGGTATYPVAAFRTDRKGRQVVEVVRAFPEAGGVVHVKTLVYAEGIEEAARTVRIRAVGLPRILSESRLIAPAMPAT